MVLMETAQLLNMEGISKSFPGVQALKEVSFELRQGEIHALIGENGAGKSTLMKILGGVYTPEEGTIYLEGEQVHFHSPSDAMRYGISVIYQEFNLVPTLSVAENIFLGKEQLKRRSATLDRRVMNREAAAVMAKLGLENFDASRSVRSLSVAQQQLVEIGKAVYNNARILVMDEPTAVLSQTETSLLFTLIRDLQKQHGLTVIYISHRLPEVLELSDRITILRDGEYVITYSNHDRQVTEDNLIQKMVGRSLSDIFPDRSGAVPGRTLLEVRNISKKGMFSDISFSLHEGEVLGFSGLIGAGRTEVMKALFGCYPIDSGEILIGGQSVRIRSIPEAVAAGIALVPEDRKQEGLLLSLSLSQNIILAAVRQVQQFGILVKRLVKSLTDSYIRKLDIRPALPNRAVKDFSGGNQQKAVIAKWLANKPSIIILDEPTRGVDVGAKVEIYRLIDDLARSGMGVIFISSEQLEVIGMCDRIIVLHNGRYSGEFRRQEATEERLLTAAAGLIRR
jgi:ribose transport system ATP-binding protein